LELILLYQRFGRTNFTSSDGHHVSAVDGRELKTVGISGHLLYCEIFAASKFHDSQSLVCNFAVWGGLLTDTWT
jgi:hypothetical protein